MNLDSESQKIGILMLQIHNFGLFRAYIKSQTLFQPCPCCFEQLHSITVLSAKDFEIIGISNDIALFQLGFSKFPVLFCLVFGAVCVDSAAVFMPCGYSNPLAGNPPVQFIQNNVG